MAKLQELCYYYSPFWEAVGCGEDVPLTDDRSVTHDNSFIVVRVADGHRPIGLGYVQFGTQNHSPLEIRKFTWVLIFLRLQNDGGQKSRNNTIVR